MDPWNEDQFFSPVGFKTSRQNGAGRFTILQKYGDQAMPSRLDQTEAQLKRWLTGIEFWPRLQPGYRILLIPGANNVEGLSPTLNELPLSEDTWNEITKRFPVQRSLVAGMNNSMTSSSCNIHSYKGTLLWTHTTVVKILDGPVWPPAFAVSGCYSKQENSRQETSTLGVVFGLDHFWIKIVQSLLESILDEGYIGVDNHYLFMARLSAELQVKRLSHVSSKLRSEAAELEDNMSLRLQEESLEAFSKRIQKVKFSCNLLEKELQATKRQLELAHDHAESYLKPVKSVSIDHDEISNHLLRRFKEMQLELATLIDDTRNGINDLCDSVDKLDGVVAQRDTRVTVILSILAAIFLPTSTVAIIFTTPIFQFPNDWRDWRYHEVNTQDGSEVSDSSSTDTRKPSLVFSGYFWIYLGICIGLTLLVLLCIMAAAPWLFPSAEKRRKGIYQSFRRILSFLRRCSCTMFTDPDEASIDSSADEEICMSKLEMARGDTALEGESPRIPRDEVVLDTDGANPNGGSINPEIYAFHGV